MLVSLSVAVGVTCPAPHVGAGDGGCSQWPKACAVRDRIGVTGKARLPSAGVGGEHIDQAT